MRHSFNLCERNEWSSLRISGFIPFLSFHAFVMWHFFMFWCGLANTYFSFSSFYFVFISLLILVLLYSITFFLSCFFSLSMPISVLAFMHYSCSSYQCSILFDFSLSVFSHKTPLGPWLMRFSMHHIIQDDIGFIVGYLSLIFFHFF